MAKRTLLSLVESPGHPNLSGLYRRLGIDETRTSTTRKAIAILRRGPVDLLVAEFFYGYGNNYAGVNVSNLDVLLHSLRKFSPDTRVIVLAGGSDAAHIDKLGALFQLHAVLRQPVTEEAMQQALEIP